MRALDRKLQRDLWRLRSQILAIALVLASGVALLVMSLSSIEALAVTADAYYERYRFAQVFASVKRAPENLAVRIADLPGVQAVQTRIVEFATLDLADFEEPALGQIVSIPERGEPILNRLALRVGRFVAPDRPDEVVLSEPFAEAHGLQPGDRLGAVMNGNKRTLEVVGIALSPEFVYAIGPGALMPDDERYGILWMGREALAAAYDLDGAFNHVSLSLLRGTNPADVVERLDKLLDRYGGVGAIERADQLSNWFLMNELRMQRSMSRILPTIFLGVAAFLSNMVLARLIATERSEIGLMKAFGYSGIEIGWHYTKMVIAMAMVGVAIGWLAGAWLGRFNTQLYGEVYRFPFLLFRPSPFVFGLSGLVSLAATLIGTVGAVRQAVALPPAEAMRPPAPLMYRQGVFSGTLIWRLLDQPTRIILRQTVRRPVRSAMTVIGVAMSVAVMVSSLQWLDSIDRIVESYFFEAQHQDITIGFVEAQPSAVLHEVRRLPGVLTVEPMRFVSADLRVGPLSHRGALQGVRPDDRLQLIQDVGGRILQVPPDGLVLSSMLADKLGVGPGDSVRVEVRQGRRPTVSLPVVDVFETFIGMPAYMDLDALNRLLREPRAVELVNVLVDASASSALFARLKDTPDVSAVVLRRAAVDKFHETMGETLLIFISFFTVFASVLGFGVVYNNARITLSERGRELATLRVLGFTRVEISYILLGEIGLLIAIGLPLGCLAGVGIAWTMSASFQTELFRVPMVIEPSTFGFSVLVALAATLVSAALVRLRVDRLDLVAVLKARE